MVALPSGPRTLADRFAHAELSKLYALSVFAITLFVFTAIELVGHRLVTTGAPTEHAIAFAALSAAALGSVTMRRWPILCPLLAVYGAVLEQVEIIQTAPTQAANLVGELFGIVGGVVITTIARLVVMRGTGRSDWRALIDPLPYSVELALTLVGFAWLASMTLSPLLS